MLWNMIHNLVAGVGRWHSVHPLAAEKGRDAAQTRESLTNLTQAAPLESGTPVGGS